jgi:hypothetical protein
MKFLEEANFDWLDMLNFFERPFRAKLIPAKVWVDLDKYRNDSKGLSNYVKKWRTRIEFLPCKSKSKIYEKYIAVGGEYDPEKRQCILQIYTLEYKNFKFTDDTWARFKFKLVQVLMHELVHFMQYDRRCDEWSNYVVPYKKVGKLKIDIERRYLSEFDEIQAYAHCIWLDYKMFRPSVSVDDLLARSKVKRDSKTLHYILKTFNYDYRNNEAIPKVIQQVGKWDRKYHRTIRVNRRPK